jgi:hypothetical protein
MRPSSNAIDVGIGQPRAEDRRSHFAPVKSCDCTAPSHATTSAADSNPVDTSRWFPQPLANDIDLHNRFGYAPS